MKNLEQYYQVLELNDNPTKEEVKKAYRQLAKKWHPDHHTGNQKEQKIAQQKFVNITNAYHALLKSIPDNQPISKQDEGYTTYSIDATYFYELGVEAAEKEDWHEAVNHFSQAIKMDDDFENAYFYRGIALEKQGFELRAKSDFDMFGDLKADRLNDTLRQVIDNLESLVSIQYSRQGLKLVHIIDDIAVLECKNYHLLSSLNEKKVDFEQAFSKVCNRPIKVKFELEEKKIVSNSRNKSRVKRKSRKQISQKVTTNLFTIGIFIIISVSLFLAIVELNDKGEQRQFTPPESIEN